MLLPENAWMGMILHFWPVSSGCLTQLQRLQYRVSQKTLLKDREQYIVVCYLVIFLGVYHKMHNNDKTVVTDCLSLHDYTDNTCLICFFPAKALRILIIIKLKKAYHTCIV